MKISVVIVCYNSMRTIRQALQSVLLQKNAEVELIVIDGGSSDGTWEFLQQYQEQLAFCSCETDHGIYDAMNKGIRQASGEYLYFLGADDSLADDEVLNRVTRCLMKDTGVDILYACVYGVDECIGNLQQVLGREFSRDELLSGNMPPHQGMFVRRELMRMGFDLQYRVAADYDFVVRALLHSAKFFYFDECIAFYSLNGASSQRKLRYKEDLCILQRCGAGPKAIEAMQQLARRGLRMERIKCLLRSLGIEGIVQRLRGYERHSCHMPHCRWCGRD